jgi:hypothetical protein
VEKRPGAFTLQQAWVILHLVVVSVLSLGTAEVAEVDRWPLQLDWAPQAPAGTSQLPQPTQEHVELQGQFVCALVRLCQRVLARLTLLLALLPRLQAVFVLLLAAVTVALVDLLFLAPAEAVTLRVVPSI